MRIVIHNLPNTTWPVGEAQDDPILPGVMYVIVLTWIIIGGIGTQPQPSPGGSTPAVPLLSAARHRCQAASWLPKRLLPRA